MEPIKKVSFEEYRAGAKVVVDIDTVPLRLRRDFHFRNRNVEEGRKLCSRCGGTGNELHLMFCRCAACGGNGVSRGNEGWLESSCVSEAPQTGQDPQG